MTRIAQDQKYHAIQKLPVGVVLALINAFKKEKIFDMEAYYTQWTTDQKSLFVMDHCMRIQHDLINLNVKLFFRGNQLSADNVGKSSHSVFFVGPWPLSLARCYLASLADDVLIDINQLDITTQEKYDMILHCDDRSSCEWRLPTLAEVQILMDGKTAEISPFSGQRTQIPYWTGTECDDPSMAWALDLQSITRLKPFPKSSHNKALLVKNIPSMPEQTVDKDSTHRFVNIEDKLNVVDLHTGLEWLSHGANSTLSWDAFNKAVYNFEGIRI